MTKSEIQFFKNKLKLYWSLMKPLQTGLLLLTGITGFISARCPVINYGIFSGLIGSLFLTISGSTVLNMVFDRDIDFKMTRTTRRPIPSGKIGVMEALFLGSGMSIAGLVLAFSLSSLYGVLIFSGIFFDVVIYTIWLKRRTSWSIIWGGISGAMPIIAGRALGIGRIDIIGIMFGFSILLWIPTHILTFNMLYFNDYKGAGIPTFPSKYGFKNTRLIIAISSIGSAFAIGIGITALGLSWGYLRLLAILSTGLLGLSIMSILHPSEKINFGLFKYASLYMLTAMLMTAIGAIS